MRRIFGFCIVAAVLAAMTSCGTARRHEQLPTEEEELTQRWAGKEYSDIVQGYGEPNRVTSDGKDGSLLVKINRYVPGTAREKARDRIFLTTVGTAFAVVIGIPIVAMISHSR